MKRISTMLFVVLLGMFSFVSMGSAEESNADMAAIKAACTAEAKGAIDVKEYIEECVKDKEEELKEAAKEAAAGKEKS